VLNGHKFSGLATIGQKSSTLSTRTSGEAIRFTIGIWRV
jgi:hypothetical protein